MNVSTIGIDIAKNVFQIHGVDAQGKVVLVRKLRRKQLVEFFAKLPAGRASRVVIVPSFWGDDEPRPLL